VCLVLLEDRQAGFASQAAADRRQVLARAMDFAPGYIRRRGKTWNWCARVRDTWGMLMGKTVF